MLLQEERSLASHWSIRLASHTAGPSSPSSSGFVSPLFPGENGGSGQYRRIYPLMLLPTALTYLLQSSTAHNKPTKGRSSLLAVLSNLRISIALPDV